MLNSEFLSEKIEFIAKPSAVPYNYRISYKVSQLCLILHLCCRKKGCSLLKLHIISTALFTEAERESLLKNIKVNMHQILVRFDPSVNRALKYAISGKLIFQQKNELFKLTQEGKIFTKSIMNEEHLMTIEKSFLNNLSDNLTEDKIKKLIMHWRYLDVKDK